MSELPQSYIRLNPLPAHPIYATSIGTVETSDADKAEGLRMLARLIARSIDEDALAVERATDHTMVLAAAGTGRAG
jgi:hypothetical protein